MDGIDLRSYQEGGENHTEVKSILGKILSGREGYETIIEKKKEILRCDCGQVLEGHEKFCPECGAKSPKTMEVKDNNANSEDNNESNNK